MGPNASPDFPYFDANFWQDWERKAHMELYDMQGIKQIDQDMGIKIFGCLFTWKPPEIFGVICPKGIWKRFI